LGDCAKSRSVPASGLTGNVGRDKVINVGRSEYHSPLGFDCLTYAGQWVHQIE
jgi:hypothetical protein